MRRHAGRRAKKRRNRGRARPRERRNQAGAEPPKAASAEASSSPLAFIKRLLFDGDEPPEDRAARQQRRRSRRRGPDDPELSQPPTPPPQPLSGSDLTAHAAHFAKLTGVRLVHDTQPIEQGGKVRDPVEPEHALRLIPTVQRVLMHYPPRVRGDLIEEIQIFGRFQMRGKPFLGCALPKQRIIQLALRPRTTAAALQTTLHHEIAHMVEQHPRFPVKRWCRLGEAHYTGRGHRDAEGKASRAEVLALGFVSQYAMKNRHEDFAELAEVAFTKPRRILKLAQQYEALAEKLDLMSDVYEALVPGLELPWER